LSVLTQPAQESFNAGEFGQRMEARVNFGKYPNAGAEFVNLLPLPQGGFTSRPGTRFIANAHSNSVRSWLTPFVFSNQQSYVLELGQNILRFFRNQAQISALDTGAAITNGTFGSNVTGWTAGAGSVTHDASNQRMIISASGGKARQSVTTTTTSVQHVVRFSVFGAPDDNVTVRVGSTAGAEDFHSGEIRKVGHHTIEFTPTSSPFHIEFENKNSKTISIDNVSVLDNEPIELPTPWTESELPNLSYVQSADIMWFAIGGATHVFRLDRFGHAAWSLTELMFQDGPYLDLNLETTTLTSSAATGNGVTVTASATTGINSDLGFRATDVGRMIRIKSGDKFGSGQIVGFNSTTNVTVDVKTEEFPTGTTTDWQLGEWNDTDGWPSVLSFIQQRMAAAATSKEPQKFWLSKSGDIENFQPSDAEGDVLDSSGINFKIASREVQTIFWIASRKKAILGTQGGNFTLSSQGAVFTPTDITADFEVSSGCLKLPPLEIRSRLVFAQRQGHKILEFADVIQSNGLEGFDAFDLTLLNDRVLKGGIVQMGFQQEPDSIIWIARGDGQIAALTYQPDQDVIGWSRQIIGGTIYGEDAIVESTTVIPGQSADGQFKDSTARNEVWMVVKREINGSVVRYIECLEKAFNADEDLQEDAFYLDSGLTLDNPITITGITKANPGVVTANSHGLSNGDEIRIVRVKGMIQVNNTSFKVANVTSNTFELQDVDSVNVNTTSFNKYSAAGEIRKKVSSISGLSHLEGETVQVFADGAVQGSKVVSSGSITLDTPASLVHAGLGYTRRFKSLKLAYGGRDGSAIGKPKNIADIILVLMETAEGALSLQTIEDGVAGAATELDLRQATDIDADPVNFFSGELRLGVTAGFDDDIRLLLTGSTPVPMTVLAVSPEIDTSS